MQNEAEAVEAVARAIAAVEYAGANVCLDAQLADTEIRAMAQAALAAARAAQGEYICKCGLRVEPHRCRDTKGEF